MKSLPPALVIVGHGSRSSSWVSTFQAFVAEVASTGGLSAIFASVTPAYLENAAPSLADAVESQLALGVAEVVVIPMFLTASTHQSEDVPGILGLPETPPHIRQRLRGEGIRVLAPGLPVRLAQVGDLQTLLRANVLRRLSLRSVEPAREAVVLVAYGSSLHHELWESLLHDLRAHLLARGYGGAHHAYCGHVVQLSPEPTAEAIVAVAAEAGVRRVHVLPLLLAISKLQTETIAAAVSDARKRIRRKDVELIYATDAILPDGDLAARTGHAALLACGVNPPLISRGLATPEGDA